MTQVVVDANVGLAWFREEAGSAPARELREAHRDGAHRIAVPPIFALELLNVVARRWRWNDDDVRAVVRMLSTLELDTPEPNLERVGRWTVSGLTAYDASYVALAEELGCDLVTDDTEVLAVAPEIARPLAAR